MSTYLIPLPTCSPPPSGPLRTGKPSCEPSCGARQPSCGARQPSCGPANDGARDSAGYHGDARWSVAVVVQAAAVEGDDEGAGKQEMRGGEEDEGRGEEELE